MLSARGRVDVRYRHLEQLFPGIAGHGAIRVVDLQEFAVQIGDGETVQGGLEDGLAFFLGRLAFGYIPADAKYELLSRERRPVGADLDVKNAAVFTPVLRLEVVAGLVYGPYHFQHLLGRILIF